MTQRGLRAFILQRCKVVGRCWLWQGGKQSAGYGTLGPLAIGRKGSSLLAHRVAYEAFYGAIPAGLFVCHSCDTRACARPDHLFVGSNADNMQDMLRKGRGGFISHPERMPRGESHGCARLTRVQVAEIRAAQGIKQRDLAKQYGVTQGTIQKIRAGDRWKD